MLIEVADFCRRCTTDIQQLVEELQDHTGREGDSEAFSWTSSLPVLARSLSSDRFARLHLHFERRGSIEVEYRLPCSGSWCDAVLLGQGPQGPASIIFELKHWTTGTDRPGPNESLIIHSGDLVSHPSVQVGAYIEYCRRFHSAVQEHDALVEGCVLFTRTTQITPYLQSPHVDLVRKYPVFAASDFDLLDRLPRWIGESLSEPNERFATEFSEGTYRQDRRFVRHVSSLMSDPTSSPFVLLDKQREAYDLILHHIEQHAARATEGERLVVIVEGPPGSGKSVVAAQLWARMAIHPLVDGNVVFCTTSGCQRSNWEHLFRTVAKNSAGAGMVIPANSFNPGLQPVWIKKQRELGHPTPVSDRRNNLALFESSGKRSRMPDLHFATTIVDEAHALIDPTTPGAEGVPPSGWCMHAGPQAWHIIRGSRISIFLTDSEQSYRDNETSTPQQIEGNANSFPGVTVVKLSLHGAQFRCGGAKEYTDWVDSLLETGKPPAITTDWRRSSSNMDGAFEFEIVESPFELESILQSRARHGQTIRLVASYARPWRTREVLDPHNIPDHLKDFCIPIAGPGEPRVWSKIWNYAPEQDYTYFVQAREGSPIANDPLCEVGCPYVVRGFDFDYVGLLWLSDLVRRDNSWVVQDQHVQKKNSCCGKARG
jgi:hypothetical protein